MTVRDVYEASLVEINKENAQSFTIEEFNYVINKSILAFVNEKYNFYAANQQISDDLRVFVKNQTFSIDDTVDIDGSPTTYTLNPTTGQLLTTIITGALSADLSTTRDIATGDTVYFGEDTTNGYLVGVITDNSFAFTPAVPATTTYDRGTEIKLEVAPIAIVAGETSVTSARTPFITFSSSDYLHLISCRVTWKTQRPSQTTVTYLVFPAKRLTYDMLNAIQNNTYLSPAPNRPYYQVFDNISNSGVVTAPAAIKDIRAYQNKPRMKIHVGSANSVMEMRSVEFDYLKIPETIVMYDSDIFSATGDTSQVLELPDYLLNEIVKRCTIYLLEKASDPRIQTQPAFNQEIPTVPMNMQMAGAAQRQQPEQTQTQQRQ